MKEQIEKMARVLCGNEEAGNNLVDKCADCVCYGICIFIMQTQKLYNADCLKQSENMVEVVRCEECQESEVCPDTLLWCNQWDRLVPPKGFCHCGAHMKGADNG